MLFYKTKNSIILHDFRPESWCISMVNLFNDTPEVLSDMCGF